MMMGRKIALSLILLIILAFASGFSHSAPQYKVEPIERLCTALSDEASYQTKFLESFRYIQQGVDDWVFTSERDFKEEFGIFDPFTKKEMERFVSALSSKGIKVIFVYVPTRGIMHSDKFDAKSVNFNYQKALDSYKKTLDELRDIGFIAPDISTLASYANGYPFFLKRDPHWSHIGAKLTAEHVGELLANLDLNGASKKYETEESGVIRVEGLVKAAAEDICGFKLLSNYIPDFQTREVFDEDSEVTSALFGDEEEIDIALVGTSFSDPYKYNFAGFLQQYSGANIVDYSVSGGGIDGAWQQLFKSEEFQSSPPKYVIWELPGWWDFRAKYFYSLTPLIYDSCASTDIISEAKNVSVNLTEETNDVLITKEFIDYPSKNIVFDLTISDFAFNEIKLRAWFSNGSSKIYTVQRNPRASYDGHSVLSLGNESSVSENGLLSLDVVRVDTDSKNSSGTIQIDFKVCENALPYGEPQDESLNVAQN